MITPKQMEIGEQVIIDVFTEIAKMHGIAKATRVTEMVTIMTDAVKAKYGESDEILDAIDMLSLISKKIKEEHARCPRENA